MNKQKKVWRSPLIEVIRVGEHIRFMPPKPIKPRAVRKQLLSSGYTVTWYKGE